MAVDDTSESAMMPAVAQETGTDWFAPAVVGQSSAINIEGYVSTNVFDGRRQISPRTVAQLRTAYERGLSAKSLAKSSWPWPIRSLFR